MLRASEQDRPDIAQQRAQWQAEQGEMDAGRLVFLDESGAKTNMTRLRARVKGGARAYDSAPSGHWSTTTMISSLRLDGQTACMVLAPALRPGDVVVMDNLSSHKDPAVRKLIQTTETALVYLPPYSPDFNPIEKMRSKIKEALRGAKARTEETLFEQIGKVLQQVTPNDTIGWFTLYSYVRS